MRMNGGFNMKELFGVPQIVDEARESAKKITKPGARPGMNWALTVLICLLLNFIGMGFASAPTIGLLFINMFRKNSGMETLEVSGTIMSALLHLFLIFTIIIFCVYVKFIEKRKIRTLGFVKKGAAVNYLIGAVAGFAIFSLGVLFCVVTGAVKISSGSDYNIGIILLALVAWLVQGMSEEVVCRGFLMTSIARRYSLTLGVIINSVLFGLLHILNSNFSILPCLNIILFGFFASLVFIKTGNIWMCGAIHALWNFVQGNFFGIQVSGQKLQDSIFVCEFVPGKDLINGGNFGLEGGLAISLVLLIGIMVMLFVPNRKKAEVADCGKQV